MKHKHYCDCFPMEAKHQAFKYAVQNKLDGQLGNLAVYSDKVLQRLLILAETTLQSKLWPGSLEAEKQCKRAGFVDGFEGKSLVCQHGRIRVNDFVITDDGTGFPELPARPKTKLPVQKLSFHPWRTPFLQIKFKSGSFVFALAALFSSCSKQSANSIFGLPACFSIFYLFST